MTAAVTMDVSAPAGQSGWSLTSGQRFSAARYSGRAMGTRCAVTVVAPNAADAVASAQAAWEMVIALDHAWSRFREDSELTALNRALALPAPVGPGAQPATEEVSVQVSAVTAALCAAMVAAWRDSTGLVDAAILDDLVAAGYDTDFDSAARSARPRHRRNVHSVSDLEVTGREIRAPRGLQLDSGGVGKGLAADLVSDVFADHPGVLVDLGGDVRARGVNADGQPWVVAAADERPWAELRGGAPMRAVGNLGQWSVTDAGVATSSVARRRWSGGHHLIDPRTGKPADTDLMSVTVVADTALAAETATKAAIIGGGDFARAWLPERVEAAILTFMDGTVERPTSTRRE